MYVLFTDTDCDMTPALAKEYGYELISMPYSVEGKIYKPYEDWDTFNEQEFYDLLRGGIIPKTSSISALEYINYFEPFLAKGYDILYVHFSGALSGTFNVLNMAKAELKEKYPHNDIYTIDTLGVSVLSLNIAFEVAELKKEGKSLEEVLAWAKEEVKHFALYFYCDDLKFFGKSGRISNFSALMGNLIGLHPLIHLTNEGKMESFTKIRGKKQGLRKILEYIKDTELDIKKHRVLIGHTNCPSLVETATRYLKEAFGEDLEVNSYCVNPTIGSHSGPDCLGISFHCKHRLN